MKAIFYLILLSAGLAGAAETQNLFFARETARDSTRIALQIEGNQVYGSQIWAPTGEIHGSRGILIGTLGEHGIIRAVHTFLVEGASQSEEVIFKLDGPKLFPGRGKLVESKKGHWKLKDPAKVRFKKSLQQVTVTEPKAGTPERKAIVDALRGPVTKHAGQPVVFTGQVMVQRNWARFQGRVTTASGKTPPNEKVATDLGRDFFALLKRKKTAGKWKPVYWGFARNLRARDQARAKFSKAPWVLFE
ncbi:MAG: hypothetical protein ACOYMS_14200 [Terrimicrobiaceae bacterium]